MLDWEVDSNQSGIALRHYSLFHSPTRFVHFAVNARCFSGRRPQFWVIEIKTTINSYAKKQTDYSACNDPAARY